MYHKFKRRCLLLLTCAVMAFCAGNVRAQDADADCVNNAHQLVQAVMRYMRDHDQFLPPTDSVASFKMALHSYVASDQVFLCPATHQYYLPNAVISGVTRAAITDDGTTVLVQDAQPHRPGVSMVAYIDNYVTLGGVSLTPIQDCVAFLTKLVNGIVSYANDYNQTLPPMQTAAACKQAVLPYTHDSRVFTCPETNLDYAINPTLSGLSLASFPDRGTVVVARDAKPHADHLATVAFLDGHVLRGGVVQPDNETACDGSVKELVIATLLYTQDYDGVLPPTQTFQQFWQAIYPYVRSSWRSRCPATQLNYAVNPNLSGVTLSTLSDLAHIVLIRDAKLHPNNTKVLGYLDGHIERR